MNANSLNWCKRIIGAAIGLAAVAGLAGAVQTNCPGPDPFGHTCTTLNPSSTCPAATCTFTNVALTGDDSCVAVTMPFSCQLYGGTTSSTVGIGTNGEVQFGGATSCTGFSNTCLLGNEFGAQGGIAGHWDDMNFGSNNDAATCTQGSAPNRIFMINYTNVPYFSGSGSASWQVQIFEAAAGCDCPVRVRMTNTNGSNSFTSGIVGAVNGLTGVCNSAPAPPANPWCIEFSKTCVPSGGGGGTCDLTPIEKKLDTITPTITTINTGITKLEGKLDTNATAVTKLEGKLDTQAGTLTTINTGITRLESKADAGSSASANLPCQIYRLLNPRLPGKPDAAGSRCLGLLPTTCPNDKACVE